MTELPPHSIEAEQGMLGSVLLDSSAVMPEVRSNLRQEAFYDIRHQIIWSVCCDLFDAQKPCDEAALYFALKQSGDLESIGGLPYIKELPNLSPSSLNFQAYFDEMQEHYLRRNLLQYAFDVKASALKQDSDLEGVLDSVEKGCLRIRQMSSPKADFVDWRETRAKTIQEYESAMEQTGRQGLRSGFIDLDNIIGGLRAQEMIVLAGTPSAGKTSLAFNIARNAAVKQQVKTGIISLETSGFKVVHRFNCIASGASGSRLLNGKPEQRDMTMLHNASKELKILGEHLVIYDRGAMNVGQAVSMMRKQYAKGCRLFIVDYIQLLDANRKTANGNERMTEVSKAIKGAAKELDCPVIAISSLNRLSAKENRPPVRSDLRETGQLEFDADVIILLHPDTNDSEVRTVKVNVDKNKDGETGKVDLTFFPPCMQFKDSIKIDQSDFPRKAYND